MNKYKVLDAKGVTALRALVLVLAEDLGHEIDP